MKKFLAQAENRNFLRLWWAQLISQFGDRIYQMALIGLIAERAPGSAFELAKLLTFTIIPVFIVGPIAGVFVDRWDRRTTLFVCDFLRGVLVLLIPIVFMDWDSMVPIYIIVFFVFCLSRFYVPAKMSIVPDLVEEKHLLMANSMLTTTGMIAFVLGCSLGGFFVDKLGAMRGFFCDAAIYFLSGLIVFSITMPRKFKLTRMKIIESSRQVIEVEKSFIQEIREGLQYLVGHKEIRFIISILFILFAAAGMIYVVIIIFIQQSFQSITKDLGVLAIFLGSGLFLGVLGHGRWGQSLPWYKTIFICLFAGGFILVSFAVVTHYYPHIIGSSVLAVFLGFVVGPIFIAASTVAQTVCEEKMRGKVFSALEIVIHFAFLAAMLVSSKLSEFVDRVWILTWVGVILACVGAIGFIRFRKGFKA